jgi:hypothetical protein
MRRLYFVPIIHTPADMGSLGVLLSETSAATLGKELWDEHQKTVSRFWEAISCYFSSLMISHCIIYQDGLVAAGEDGLKIVREGVRQGSRNYTIVADLLQRGAALVKTEDIALVQKEYSYLKQLISAKSARQKEAAAVRYKLAQGKLLEDRDNYIAGVIENTLQEGEMGVLFIGAYHEVLSKLPAEINIFQVKQLTKVREYHKLLGRVNSKSGKRYQDLADYLASPVSDSSPE